MRVLIQKRCLTSHLPLTSTRVTMALWFEEGGGLPERHGQRANGAWQQRAHPLLSVSGCSICGSPGQLLWLRPSAAAGEAGCLWEVDPGKRNWSDKLITRVPSATWRHGRASDPYSVSVYTAAREPAESALSPSLGLWLTGSSKSQSTLYDLKNSVDHLMRP